MNRKHRQIDGYELHMIRNVRPIMELSVSPRWPALTVIFGVLIASALLAFALRG